MTKDECDAIMKIIRQELEDIEVGKDDRCHWTDVANATAHIRARVAKLSAPGLVTSHNSGERLPSSDAADSGADTLVTSKDQA